MAKVGPADRSQLILLRSAKGTLLDFCVMFKDPCSEPGYEVEKFDAYHSIRPHSGGAVSVSVKLHKILAVHCALYAKRSSLLNMAEILC